MTDTDKSELTNEEIAKGFDDMNMPVSAQLVRELPELFNDTELREVLLSYHNEPVSDAFIKRLEATEKAIQALITQQCNQARINLLKNIKAQSHIVDTDLGERYELNRPMDFDYMIYQLELQAKETEA